MLYLFNNRALPQDMFSTLDGTSWRMSNAAAAAVVCGYEERASSLIKSPRSDKRIIWRRLMIEQAETYAAHVEDRESYKPYITDY